MWAWGALLTPCHLDINSFQGLQHLLNNIQLPKKSFNTEEQCQNINFKAIGVSTILYISILTILMVSKEKP